MLNQVLTTQNSKSLVDEFNAESTKLSSLKIDEMRSLSSSKSPKSRFSKSVGSLSIKFLVGVRSKMLPTALFSLFVGDGKMSELLFEEKVFDAGTILFEQMTCFFGVDFSAFRSSLSTSNTSGWRSRYRRCFHNELTKTGGRMFERRINFFARRNSMSRHFRWNSDNWDSTTSGFDVEWSMTMWLPSHNCSSSSPTSGTTNFVRQLYRTIRVGSRVDQ